MGRPLRTSDAPASASWSLLSRRPLLRRTACHGGGTATDGAGEEVALLVLIDPLSASSVELTIQAGGRGDGATASSDRARSVSPRVALPGVLRTLGRVHVAGIWPERVKDKFDYFFRHAMILNRLYHPSPIDCPTIVYWAGGGSSRETFPSTSSPCYVARGRNTPLPETISPSCASPTSNRFRNTCESPPATVDGWPGRWEAPGTPRCTPDRNRTRQREAEQCN